MATSTTTPAELTPHLVGMLEDLKFGSSDSCRYLSGIDLVLGEGTAYTETMAAPGWLQGPLGNCFANAQQAVDLDPSLTYCEGYASYRGSPMLEHAWTVTPEGIVMDVTWDDGPTGYVGIALDPKWVRRTLARCHSASVLFGSWSRSSELERDGLPAAARAQKKLSFTQRPFA